MHTILAIETSVSEASIALWRDGVWMFEQGFASDRQHNSMIFNCLDDALKALDGLELSAVLVGRGPGSYSGTRVGIAAAQGVAIARGCAAAGIGSLAATPVARENRHPTQGQSRTREGTLGPLAIGDARRGLYYISPILESGEALDAELMDAETFIARLKQSPGSPLFTLDDPAKLGLDADLEKRVIRTKPEARLLIDVWLGLPEPRQRALAAQPIAPAYLRAPFTSKAKGGHPLLRKG